MLRRGRGEDADMPARIGRSYPRSPFEPGTAEPSSSGWIPAHLKVAGALLAFLSALGLIGWFLAR